LTRRRSLGSGLARQGFDCQLSASRQTALGNDIEAKPQSVGFNARSSRDLNHDPRDFTQALLSGAIDDEVDKCFGSTPARASGFVQCVHRSAEINATVD
jgi:hypothetical protein